MKEQILVKCHCFRCGFVGESILNNAGPHIKQSCLNCGSYKKFIPKKEIPPKEVIKQAIWIKVKNLNKISEQKEKIFFIEGLIGIDAQLEYYRFFNSFKSITL